jgi:hypothetical protein
MAKPSATVSEVESATAHEQLVARCARAARSRRDSLRVLLGGHSAVVHGHHTLLRKLLCEDAVAYLHATELDVVGRRP